MLAGIQALPFLASVHAQPVKRRLQHEPNDQRGNRHEGYSDENAEQLRNQQGRIARVQKTAHFGPGQLGNAEHARQKAAYDTADGMAPESVKRIVVSETRLKKRNGRVADRGRNHAHDNSGPHVDESSGGRNGNQAGHDSRARADKGHLARMGGFDQHPREHRCRRSNHGIEQSERGNGIGGD